jgi:hypothetical protein
LRANIDLDVSIYLVAPEILASGRPPEEVTVMAVPEATVRKYHCPISGKNQVWFPWQARIVQAESKTESVQSPSQYHFGLGIFSPNPGHHPASRFGRNVISHWRPSGPCLAS